MKHIWRSFLIFCLVLLLILTPSVLAIAQNQANSQEQETIIRENKVDGYPVIIDGKTLFLVQKGIGSFSAEERAQAITDRIEKFAQDFAIPVEQLKIEENTDENLLYVSSDKNIILSITPQDAQAARTTQKQLAENDLKILQKTIEQYREDRKPETLLKSIIYSAIATVFLLIFFGIIFKISSRVFPRGRSWIETRVPRLSIQNFELISSQQLSNFCLRFLQLIRLIFILSIFYVYLTLVLRLFPWTRTIGESILSYFLRALELTFKAIASYLPNIFTIIVIIFVTYYSLRLVKPFFMAIQRGNLVIPGFYADWAKPTYKILLFLIIAFAAIIAFPYLPGFNSPAFQGVSVFLGILFSLGSTSAIANIIGGIILIYTRAFQIGDRVSIGDITGDIIDKSLLVTRIRTIKNMVVTIPNSAILTGNVINFSVSSRELNTPLILHTTVTMGYDIPWRTIHQILIEAALATEYILKVPHPFVLQTSLDDFCVSYQLNAYTDHPNLIINIYSELHQNIQDKCNGIGIEIMSPHYTSLRDGNLSTIPANYLPSDYLPPPFRIQSSDENKDKKS